MRKIVSALNAAQYPLLPCLRQSAVELVEKMRVLDPSITSKPITLLIIPQGYEVEKEAYIRQVASLLRPQDEVVNWCETVEESLEIDSLLGNEWLVVDRADSPRAFLDLIECINRPLSPTTRTVFLASDSRCLRDWPRGLLARIAHFHEIPLLRPHNRPWRTWEELREVFEHGIKLASREKHIPHPVIEEFVFRKTYLESLLEDTTTPQDIVTMGRQSALVAVEHMLTSGQMNAPVQCTISAEHLLTAYTQTHRTIETALDRARHSYIPPVLRHPLQ